MVSNPNEILKAEQHFIWNYTGLGKLVYTATKQNYFLSKNCQNYPMFKNQCVIIISQFKNAKKLALLTFKNTKSRGNDGITSVFYKSF